MAERLPLVNVNGNYTTLPTGYSLKNNPAWFGERGIAGGGYTGSVSSNIINYVTISTIGNAADFGDIISAVNAAGGFSGN